MAAAPSSTLLLPMWHNESAGMGLRGVRPRAEDRGK
jgi:hypothetical protein